MKKLFHEKKIHIAIIIIASTFIVAKNLPDVIAQSGSDQNQPSQEAKEDIYIDNSFAVKVPDDIVEAVKKTLQDKPKGLFDGKKYALTNINQKDNWAVISVAIIAENLPPVFDVPFSDTSLMVAIRDSNNIWSTALEGTQEFETLKEDSPEGILDTNKSVGSSWNPFKVYAISSSDITYLIPWGSNQWNYDDGWHQGCSECWWALDVGTGGSDKNVYAAAAGTVGICTDSAGSANVYITDSNNVNLKYAHLDSTTLSVSSGQNISAGTYLGSLKTGSFNFNPGPPPTCTTSGTCGCASQNANYGHMHWGIPTDREFYVEGWSITYSDDTWTSGSKTIDPSGTLFGRADSMIFQNQNLNITRNLTVDNAMETGPNVNINSPNGNVYFEAGTTIKLVPGFIAENGSQFHAKIR